MKILHLEDNPTDAEFFREVLQAEIPDCAVTVASNRADWVSALRSVEPDLILSDFSMPGFSGGEALTLAREEAPLVPFIFLSGTIGEERAIHALQSGAHDYVLKDNPGRLISAIGRAMRDTASRKSHAEAERRIREQADIIDRASEAIVVSGLGGRITHWNRGAEQIYGIPAADALDRGFEELFPDAEFELTVATEAANLRGEWRGEVHLTTAHHGPVIVDLHLTLIRDDEGHPKARLGIAVDVTEKKKIEEQFLRAQRLENIGLLASGIAHDLNNVLAPVLMAAPLLRARATDPTDLHMLQSLEKSAERGARLVRQILGFAHGASSAFRPTQVKHLIRDISDIADASFPKSIVLREHVPAELWPVNGNPTQIHQVILNLAVNARDAMLPRGGTLQINARNEFLDASAARSIEGARPGAFLVIEVRDNGTGIPPEVLTRIWEPFYTTKGEGKGTGLGLSTVRGIVTAHGGFTTVETHAGRGTVFRVYLPAAEGSGAEEASSAAAVLPNGSGELILVVDDDEAIRETATATLTHFGYRTVTACDGVEAIGVFTQHATEVRLVITDLNMPNLDGTALARVLQRLQPDLKILSMSGFGADPLPGEESLMAGRLQKPFTTEALLHATHDLVAVREIPA